MKQRNDSFFNDFFDAVLPRFVVLEMLRDFAAEEEKGGFFSSLLKKALYPHDIGRTKGGLNSKLNDQLAMRFNNDATGIVQRYIAYFI